MTVPYITVSEVSYEIDSLNDRCKLLASDLVRTVQEYNAIMKNYRQSLTLTNTYTGGLKSEVEKAELPIVFPYAIDEETPVIKIGETSYDASEMPNEVKAYVSELFQVNKQRTSLEFRLRQLDAARVSYIKAIQDEVVESKPTPMDPQPDIDATS